MAKLAEKTIFTDNPHLLSNCTKIEHKRENMKKFFILSRTLPIIFSMVACHNQTTNGQQVTQYPNSIEQLSKSNKTKFEPLFYLTRNNIVTPQKITQREPIWRAKLIVYNNCLSVTDVSGNEGKIFTLIIPSQNTVIVDNNGQFVNLLDIKSNRKFFLNDQIRLSGIAISTDFTFNKPILNQCSQDIILPGKIL